MFLNQAHLVDKLFNLFDLGFLIYNTVLVILFHGFAMGINLSNMWSVSTSMLSVMIYFLLKFNFWVLKCY